MPFIGPHQAGPRQSGHDFKEQQRTCENRYESERGNHLFPHRRMQLTRGAKGLVERIVRLTFNRGQINMRVLAGNIEPYNVRGISNMVRTLTTSKVLLVC